MSKYSKYPFCKLYKGLMMAFSLPEAAFMAYMADLNNLREAGGNTLRTMKNHLGHLGIGRYAFEKCITKTISMGLLERIEIDGTYDYIWDQRAYEKLLIIVSANSNYKALQQFCKRAFDEEKRKVASITEGEIERLSKM